MKSLKAGLAGIVLGGALLVAQQPPPPGPPPQGQPQAQMLAPQQLDTMVAPIALYPDALLSQVLVATTYPLEIAEAAQWIQQHNDLRGSQLVDAARQMNWDPSIQALVVFPDVLSRLAADIRWTTDLGNAFLAQQADVMNAVQTMRQQAMSSGRLNSNAQETVTTQMEEGHPEIEIQPTNPEVVYVPYYDPAYVWGAPAWGYYPAWNYAGFGFGFFPGIYVGGFFGGLGWGGWGWGLNWYHCSIFQRPYFFNHYGFGGFHGGAAFRGGNVLWAHDANHRLGVSYPNRALNARYGATSAARAPIANGRGGGFAAPRAGTATGGWNRFGQTNRGSAPLSSYRSTPYAGSNNAYRPNGSNSAAGRSYGTGAGRSTAAPAYRSTPYSGGATSHASPYGGSGAYRPSQSYGGGSVHANGGSVHSYGGSVHSNGGGAARSSGGGGGRVSSGGGGHASGGGGGHVSGGGGGGHASSGGGGGSHGGHR